MRSIGLSILIVLLMLSCCLITSAETAQAQAVTISRKEALGIASRFFKEITGSDIEEYAEPSSLWCIYFCDDWDTELKYSEPIPKGTPCWYFEFISGKTFAPVLPHLYINAVTGDILWWTVTIRGTDIRYYNGCPSEKCITRDRAYDIAHSWVLSQYDPIGMNTPRTGSISCFVVQSGKQDSWIIDISFKPDLGLMDEWRGSYQCTSETVIAADTGEILHASLTVRLDTGSEFLIVRSVEFNGI